MLQKTMEEILQQMHNSLCREHTIYDYDIYKEEHSNGNCPLCRHFNKLHRTG